MRYLVGTPKGRLTQLEKDLATKDWQQAKDDVHVKLLHRDGELYVLARSLPRRGKESAMRRRKLKAYWARLKELQKRNKLTRDDLLLAIGAAKQKAGRNAHSLVILHLPASGAPVTAETFRIELDRDKLKATKPEKVRQLLLDRLGFILPAQPPPEIRNPKPVVETF